MLWTGTVCVLTSMLLDVGAKSALILRPYTSSWFPVQSHQLQHFGLYYTLSAWNEQKLKTTMSFVIYLLVLNMMYLLWKYFHRVKLYLCSGVELPASDGKLQVGLEQCPICIYEIRSERMLLPDAPLILFRDILWM